jgi:hypothetical protein
LPMQTKSTFVISKFAFFPVGSRTGRSPFFIRISEKTRFLDLPYPSRQPINAATSRRADSFFRDLINPAKFAPVTDSDINTEAMAPSGIGILKPPSPCCRTPRRAPAPPRSTFRASRKPASSRQPTGHGRAPPSRTPGSSRARTSASRDV